MNFYTNVLQYGGKILIRGIKDGKSFAKKINYQPSLFIKSKKDNTTFTTLQDEPVEQIQLPSIDKARNFLKQYKYICLFEKFYIVSFTKENIINIFLTF